MTSGWTGTLVPALGDDVLKAGRKVPSGETEASSTVEVGDTQDESAQSLPGATLRDPPKEPGRKARRIFLSNLKTQHAGAPKVKKKTNKRVLY